MLKQITISDVLKTNEKTPLNKGVYEMLQV